MSLKALRGIIPIALLLLLWQLVGNVHSSSTPSPSTWWPAFKQLSSEGVLWPALGKTMRLYLEGLAVSVILGVVLGMALGASRRLTQALSPLLEFLRATPAAAIVPGVLLLFHANSRSQIGIVVYGSIWPVLLNTTAARRALAPLRLDVAHSMGLSWWDRMRKIVLPSLLPEIVVGIRVTATICLIITLLVDFLVATGGIGYLLVEYQQQFDATDAFALLATIGVVGILLNLLLGTLERLVLRRWPRGATAA
jgi:ABC-type nitrate/sulfonate/bicarbonate transport system permease component